MGLSHTISAHLSLGASAFWYQILIILATLWNLEKGKKIIFIDCNKKSIKNNFLELKYQNIAGPRYNACLATLWNLEKGKEIIFIDCYKKSIKNNFLELKYRNISGSRYNAGLKLKPGQISFELRFWIHCTQYNVVSM